jgi:hypothetical protein
MFCGRSAGLSIQMKYSRSTSVKVLHGRTAHLQIRAVKSLAQVRPVLDIRHLAMIGDKRTTLDE